MNCHPQATTSEKRKLQVFHSPDSNPTILQFPGRQVMNNNRDKSDLRIKLWCAERGTTERAVSRNYFFPDE
jgi:hypothetical protein